MTEETKTVVAENTPTESAQTEAPKTEAPKTETTRSERPQYSGPRREGGYQNRGGDRGGRPGGFRSGPRKFFRRRGRVKVCFMCKNNLSVLDYKDVPLLQRFINDRGKILPRRMTGTCSKHQRLVTRTVKTARNIALLPFAAE